MLIGKGFDWHKTASLYIVEFNDANKGFVMVLKDLFFIGMTLFLFSTASCKLADITPQQASAKLHEIMQSHAIYKQLTTELVKRALLNYLEELDPTKSYFVTSDIQMWLEPSDAELQQILYEYNHNNFSTFYKINKEMEQAIERRRRLEKTLDLTLLPKKINPEEFKNMKWAVDQKGLIDRITKIKALQAEAAAKLNDGLKEKSLQRIAKRQLKIEEDILNHNPLFQQKFILTYVLKATAAALDTHTAYFTPDEAAQFMIGVQQKLHGIGAQLRDDINGFTVVKIIEGSPAANGKQLKVKDLIIAVNGEPVVGMDIMDAVDLIRGEANTPVQLTVIRELGDESHKKQEKIDITIPRGEVVLNESRYEVSYESFGDGAIAYIKLYSFYQDEDSSSADDIAKAFEKLKKEQVIKGVILDLRYNTGGLLTQAVNVAGLFITKGIIASIKDDTGQIQNLRDFDSALIWNGPLIILVNRASASASEIVAEALQDYGRALIVGDDHTYGKGSFQTFTLNTTKNGQINAQGEYKVTRGRYYTVSGKTPQLIGVQSDIVVPGILSEMEVGEKYAKYPLETDKIKENFNDDLSDISFFQREKVKTLYKFDLQKKVETYVPYLDKLKKNSEERLVNNKNYKKFLEELKKKDKEKEAVEEESPDQCSQGDLQLNEAYNIIKDLIYLDCLHKNDLLKQAA